MAEFGAHLTTTQSNQNNVSIFEALAQQTLSYGLRRATLFICKVLYENNPEKFERLYLKFDEWYLLIDLCVQFSHLKAYNASFSETFYGLKRVSSDNTNNNGRLNAKQFYSSLLLLIGCPYLKSKCDAYYQRIKFAHLERRIPTESRRHIYFLKIYPLFCQFWELLTLVYHITYAVNKNKFYSPLLHLSSTVLVNITGDDVRNRSANIEILDSRLSWYQYCKRLSWLSAKWVANGLGVGLSVTAFFIQFLDYWYTRPNVSPNFAAMPIPPPPLKNQIEVPVEKCPICLQKRKNDTALSTSGFVFCYSCIRSYLMKNNRCPITGVPSNTEHLIKIYTQDI